MIPLLDALRAFVGDALSNPLDVAIASLLIDVLEGKLTKEAAVKALLELALDSGLAPSLLRDALTARGIAFAEDAADIAEEAKLAIKAMQGT